jgi:hypothetical protein
MYPQYNNNMMIKGKKTKPKTNPKIVQKWTHTYMDKIFYKEVKAAQKEQCFYKMVLDNWTAM